jgi:arylsulfatase A-like enzyme
MSNQFSRREIIKLASLLSLSYPLPALINGPNQLLTYPGAPNVLFIVFDTMSSKHLSLYGYERDTTPHFNRIAEKAYVFRNHYASAEFTTPGTASLLTGVYPFTHRAIKLNFDTVLPEFEGKNFFTVFDDYYRIAYSHNRLANALLLQFQNHLDSFKEREALYFKSNFITSGLFKNDADTALLSWSRTFMDEGDGYSNSMYLSKILDFFDDLYAGLVSKDFPRGVPVNHEEYFLIETAVDWIVEQVEQLPQPFLGYFHLLPPHAPYNTRKDFFNRFLGDGYIPIQKPEHYFSKGHSFENLVNLRLDYDEFILYCDSEFGRLYDYLETIGILENTWLVLTSDHGEMFERGIWEHTVPTLHEPVIRVPLMIVPPGGLQGRVDIFETSSAVDVLPTLLHLTGKEIPKWCEGKILAPFRSTDQEIDPAIYSVEAKLVHKYAPLKKATMVIIEWPYKLMRYTRYEEIPTFDQFFEMFNLEEDPEELINIYDPADPVAERLERKLRRRLEAADAPYMGEDNGD